MADELRNFKSQRTGRTVGVGATYLYADAILADPDTGCGVHCPWLGLFHVEVRVSDADKFLAEPLEFLIPALRDELQRVVEGPPPDSVAREYRAVLERTLGSGYLATLAQRVDTLGDRVRIHMWSSVPLDQPQIQSSNGAIVGDLQALQACTGDDTICYAVACSEQPAVAGGIWCQPPSDPAP